MISVAEFEARNTLARRVLTSLNGRCMSESIQSTLTSAFEMIELGHPDRAVTVLQPLLTQAADNPDVWWVYAHAVSDPQVAHAALTRVLRLEPGYPEAVTLLRRLEKQLRAQRANLLRERPPATAITARTATTYDATPAPPTEFPELPLTDQNSGCLGGGFNVLLVIVAIILIAVVALLALEPQLNLWLPTPTPEQGQVSQDTLIIRTWVPTAIPTTESNPVTITPEELTPVVSATNQIEESLNDSEIITPTQPALITSTPSSSALIMPEIDLSALLGAVPQLELRRNELLRFNSDGWSIVLPLCGIRGNEESIHRVQENLVNMASASSELPDLIHTIAVELMNCSTNESLAIIGVQLNVAQKFAAGGMSEKAFIARLHPLTLE